MPADRARWRFTAAYRFSPRLQVGLEYNPAVEEVGLIGNYVLATETATRPHINVGTSSDRIGTPRGPRSYFITFAKSVPGTTLAPYVSINYSEHDEAFNFPFGVNLRLSERWDLLPMNDGRKTHLLLTYKQGSRNVTLMWVWLRHPGISLNWGF